MKSAGILLYRTSSGALEVLLVHPGGPFWSKKDAGAWTIPKGGIEESEDPLAAARRELREETGLEGTFPRTIDIDGVPPGLLGYEEHVAGSKGLHMNFVFVADVDGGEVSPNHEFGEFRWVDRADLQALESPVNVRQFGILALDAVPVESVASVEG